jgi:hypothetical protein
MIAAEFLFTTFQTRTRRALRPGIIRETINDFSKQSSSERVVISAAATAAAFILLI